MLSIAQPNGRTANKDIDMGKIKSYIVSRLLEMMI